jgi:electron transport complex protein RnfB
MNGHKHEHKHKSEHDGLYKELAEALGNLPEGFPRVPSGIEVEIIKRIFTPEEAQLGRVMSEKFETADEIAKKAGMPVEKARNILDGMHWPKRVSAGRARRDIIDGVPKYRLRPFMVGFWEGEQKHFSDPELAHLVFHYFKEGGMKGLRSLDPPYVRAVPTKDGLAQVPVEQVATYDDIRKLVEEADWCNVYTCGCRKHKHVAGTSACDFPLQSCMVYYKSDVPIPEGVTPITKEEAIELLDEFERLGLVHIIANFKKGLTWVCNCCGCCCFELMAYNNYQTKSVNKSNYFPVVDDKECNLCGACRNRCQVYACKILDGKVTIDYDRCLGCGLCVTGCPLDAVTLKQRPKNQQIEYCETLEDWETARLKNR